MTSLLPSARYSFLASPLQERCHFGYIELINPQLSIHLPSARMVRTSPTSAPGGWIVSDIDIKIYWPPLDRASSPSASIPGQVPPCLAPRRPYLGYWKIGIEYYIKITPRYTLLRSMGPLPHLLREKDIPRILISRIYWDKNWYPHTILRASG